MHFSTTADIPLPEDPLLTIIGQEEAVRIARVVARQRRNMLLVGPPGTGKSMVAQAISVLLPRPQQEISVIHNPQNPERPIVELRQKEDVEKSFKKTKEAGKVHTPTQVPVFVAERLGFRCRRCGSISPHNIQACPSCGADKYRKDSTPFDDLLFGFQAEVLEDQVHTTRTFSSGKEEIIIYERTKEGKIVSYDKDSLKGLEYGALARPRKVIVPLNRNPFVQATGASETEFLGDIKHDPYGGHPEVGIPPYQRVMPGAVHEAHEGVLFVDELSTLGHLQRYLLTAMQEKKFSIVGRNPSSTGAAVKVENVPCDFLFVGAINTADLQKLLPPLRSRITGNGYEVLMNTVMPDTEANRDALAQFVSQEIRKDGKIPHANREAVELLINEARRRAKIIDDSAGLSLRLRDISGILKLAGDLAAVEEAPLITEAHMKNAILKSKAVEEQLTDRYGSMFKAEMSDYPYKKNDADNREVG
ncbi:MAG: ATP-binding protein [Candidatus Micrarchaeota archaeon]